MDWLELCRRLRANDFVHDVYIILLTSKNNKADLIEGMEAGADDFLSKPFHANELQLRIRAGERILRLESTLEERNQKLHEMYQYLEQASSQIRKDLEAATTMQQSLLPETAVTLCDVRLTGYFVHVHLWLEIFLIFCVWMNIILVFTISTSRAKVFPQHCSWES